MNSEKTNINSSDARIPEFNSKIPKTEESNKEGKDFEPIITKKAEFLPKTKSTAVRAKQTELKLGQLLNSESRSTVVANK